MPGFKIVLGWSVVCLQWMSVYDSCLYLSNFCIQSRYFLYPAAKRWLNVGQNGMEQIRNLQ